MFAVRYGLRQWRKNKLQSFVLIVGLALFTAFTINLMAVAPSLFSVKQAWMSGDGRYATIGLQSHNGSFSLIDKKNLDTYRKSPAVEALMMVTTRSAQHMQDNEGKSHSEASITYLSDNFLEEFSEQLPNVFSKLGDSGVLISHRYWQESLGGKPLTDISFSFTINDTVLPVVGVLPEHFKLFQGLNTDVVMTGRQVEMTYGVNFGEFKPPAEQIEKILRQLRETVAMRYGIAKLKAGYQVSDIKPVTAESDEGTDKDSVVLLTESSSYNSAVVEGVQFHPMRRAQLVKQWWVVFGLSVGLLLLGLFNLLTSNFSRYLQRQQEFQARQSVGATAQHLLKQLFVENALIGVFAATVGAVVSFILLRFVQDQLVFVSTVSATTQWLAVAVSLALVMLLTTVVGVVPFILLNREAKFSRSKTAGQSVIQRTLNSGNMVLQVALSILAIVCAVSLWLTQQERLQQVPIRTSTVQMTLVNHSTADNNTFNIQELKAKLEKLPYDVGYSQFSLVDSAAYGTKVSRQDPDSPDALSMQVMPLSENYFSVLGLTDFIGEANPATVNKVVINRAAAEVLGFEQPEDALGQQIYVKNPMNYWLIGDEPIIVQGVIGDLPHASLNQRSQPIVYNVMAASDVHFRQIRFITAPDNEARLKSWLEQQGELVGGEPEILNNVSVKQHIEKQDKAWFLLAKIILGLALLVCALSATSLYQQVVGYLIEQNRRFAVMQAVGAQLSDIVKSISFSLLPRVLVGLLLGGLAMWAVSGWFTQQFYADLLTTNHLTIGLALVVLLILVSYLPAIVRQLSQPIQRILHEE